MNLRQWDSTPYPTAKAPGEQPVSAAAFGVERSQAHAELAQQNSRSEEPEVESGCTRSGHPYLSSRKLHLSSVLTSTVFVGRQALSIFTAASPHAGIAGVQAGLFARVMTSVLPRRHANVTAGM